MEIEISGLKFELELFTKGFKDPRGPAACTSQCCRHGVYLDPAERDRILDKADMVEKYLDESQTRDRNRWFDNNEEDDGDFPSGRHVSTEVYNDKCVFLDKLGRCSLQVTENEEHLARFSLKPYYCVLFPLTKVDGVFGYDDLCSGESDCCTAIDGGTRKIVEICANEFEYALGPARHQEVLQYCRNNFLIENKKVSLKNV